MKPKIAPLFQSSGKEGCPSKEQMVLFLDETSEAPEKKAFLNHTALCESCRREWQTINYFTGAGASLPMYEPDPAIRDRVLKVASSAGNSEPLPTNKKTRYYLRSPGWRLTWAALFLAISWVGISQFHTTEVTSIPIEQLDSEMLTLEQDLEELQFELGMDVSGYFTLTDERA